jgi:hypothetical protein
MLVLVATNELQGASGDDYSHTVEGELVTAVVIECASGDRCGCSRGFPGLASSQATTTAMIVDRPGVTEHDLRDAVYDWLERGGWIDLLEQTSRDRGSSHGGGRHADDDIDEIVEAMIDEHVEVITAICTTYPEGTVVCRRGHLVSARSMPSAA